MSESKPTYEELEGLLAATVARAEQAEDVVRGAREWHLSYETFLPPIPENELFQIVSGISLPEDCLVPMDAELTDVMLSRTPKYGIDGSDWNSGRSLDAK